MKEKNYLLLDSGKGQKLERIGKYTIVRPCALAIWQRKLEEKTWQQADATFSRERENRWSFEKKIPPSWVIQIENLKFKISFTDFGHLGIFPEHFSLFDILENKIQKRKEPNILNLFGYTGAMTIKAASLGAKVCHLDASMKSVAWAKENASLNALERASVRYIVDDALKFLKRELRRGVKYDGIILDPPSFGRGTSGQVFKIERDLFELLYLCKSLLSTKPLFIMLTSHTPGFTPKILENILNQVMRTPPKILEGFSSSGELILSCEDGGIPVPSGSYLVWEAR